MTDSSCSFYNRVRQTFCGVPTEEGVGSGSLSEIQQKIAQISQQRFAASQTSVMGRAPPSQPQGLPGAGASPIRPPVPVIPPATTTSTTEEALSPEELAALRVVEFDVRVSLYTFAVSDTAAGTAVQSPHTYLCEDATVTVFPRHIVFLKSSGEPVSEVVLAELYELTEDAQQQTLTFYYNRPTGTVALELRCPSTAARTAMYKVVCSKRNLVEAARNA